GDAVPRLRLERAEVPRVRALVAPAILLGQGNARLLLGARRAEDERQAVEAVVVAGLVLERHLLARVDLDFRRGREELHLGRGVRLHVEGNLRTGGQRLAARAVEDEVVAARLLRHEGAAELALVRDPD